MGEPVPGWAAMELAGKARTDVEGCARLGIITVTAVEAANLCSCFAVQPLLIGVGAGRATEPHAPVAMDAEAKLVPAMVASHGHTRRLHALGAGARLPSILTDVATAVL
jgi:hypothetical protein